MNKHRFKQHANIKMLEFVTIKLADLCDELVFVGGCTTALFVTDEAVPDIRYTLDVDCIIDVISLNNYYKIEKRLTQLGFKKSKQADEQVRAYLVDELATISQQRAFHDALPGHFIHYGQLADDRIELFLEKWELIINQ